MNPYHPTNYIDLEGHRFGRWLAISRAPSRGYMVYFLCRCDCGVERPVSAIALRTQRSRSCGCLRRERTAEVHTKHGHSRRGSDSLFGIWRGIKRRCENPLHKQFNDYGGRGITICAEWSQSFEAFARDMGKRPSLKHTVDRCDNNGNYEPGNCRWATKKEQAANRRPRLNSPKREPIAGLLEWI